MAGQTTPFTAVHDATPHLEDYQLVQLAIDGDRGGLERLQRFFEAPLVKFLISRGADIQEAEEISQEMWADLLVSPAGSFPKIARYDGRCKLSSFLNTIAVNRLVTLKRKQARVEKLRIQSIDAPVSSEAGAASLETVLPGIDDSPAEQPLVTLLKQAIEEGFKSCTPEQFILIRLAYGDRLRFADLARMWGCNPATISRRLDEARKTVAKAVMQHIKKVDPWIELEWSDFSQLCKSASLGALGFD